ncbi:phage late control D family protein [Heliobacterium mobile]|uniref:phage late control D family protein n=1 Tax=Heliobacterium mobile TaxID=28064 RepID=UPI0012D82BE4|nr:contractile injection system protein, VgrG/Pvc8 family [Heliobacterium mobile]
MKDLELTQDKYEYTQLEKKYRNFLGPSFKIVINGANLSQQGIVISEVTVELDVGTKADSFQFDVVNAYDPTEREFRWIDDYFSLGNYVEIYMGYVDELVMVFYGLITKVEYAFTEEEVPSLRISGMDLSFLMMKGSDSNVWTQKKYSEVAQSIGASYSFTNKIDDTKVKLPIIVQKNKTDYHFLSWMAEINDFVFFIKGRTLYFQSRFTNTVPVVTLTIGENLYHFSIEANLSAPTYKVAVRGWNEKSFEEIEATSTNVHKLGSSKTGCDMVKLLSEKTEYELANVSSKEEAQQMADAILNRKAMDFVLGFGETTGLPEIQAGRYIQVDKLGKQFKSPFYLQTVTHRIDESGYTTRFTVKGNGI